MPAVIPQFKKKVNYVQSVEPTDPQMGDSWLDTSNNTIKIYSGVSWSIIWTSEPGWPYGYTMGGNRSSTPLNEIDRFDFPFDTGNAYAAGTLSAARYSGGDTCNSATHGFFLGGADGVIRINTIDRLDFPFHPTSSAAARGTLSQAKAGVGSCNSSSYGYCFGGVEQTTGQPVAIMERLDFPFDTGNAYARGNLNATTMEAGGMNSSNYGYVLGGNRDTPNQYQVIKRFQFPFDSGNAVAAGMFDVPANQSSGFNSSSAGYAAAVQTAATNYVYKLSFPWTIGTASSYTNLNNSRANAAACNSSSYGYIMGGFTTAAIKTMERMEFAADSTVASRGELSASRYAHVGLDGTDFVGMFL